MNSHNISFNKPYTISGESLDFSLLKGRYSGNGHYTKLNEQRLQNLTGSPRILMTNSCTSALELACLLIDLKPGDEVIMPSYTFVSTANAAVLRGATPVFCDVKEHDLNIDEDKIEQCITTDTRAIIVVHYAGNSCEMAQIMELAKRYDLLVIEDAAQCIDSFTKEGHLGTIGDFGCFSFHETKNIHCGEGGALAINNYSYFDKAEIMREKGTNRDAFIRKETELYTWLDKGGSFLPSEFQMLYLNKQLESVKDVTKKRTFICGTYRKGFQTLIERGQISVVGVPELGNGHIFAFLCHDEKQRNCLIAFLKSKNIQAAFHYIPLHTSEAGMRFGRFIRELVVTDDIYSRIIRLPVYHSLSECEQNLIIETVCEYFMQKV